MRTFSYLEDLFLDVAEAIRPPERITVSEAAAKYRRVYNPGHYIGPWKNEMAPYLTEIMDTMTSRDYKGIVFAGPARCGKTDIFFNLLTYTLLCDPADIMAVQMTQANARDWSVGDLRKFFRHSKTVAAKVGSSRHDMNVHDVRFLSGNRLLVKWPTISELSGKTLRYTYHFDYDRRGNDDVDGEGPAFDLELKRTQTFGRFGMAVAESSPGFEITNPRWNPKTPHEAPPVAAGILNLYNRGDRRRRYWRCIDCGRAFEPSFKLLNYPDSADFVEAGEMATMRCPFCDFDHTHEPGPGQLGKLGMELERARWIRDGMRWEQDGTVSGEAYRSMIASFWLKGPAAAFMSWAEIVTKYLTAKKEFELTGAFGGLKTNFNLDQGEPYLPPNTEVSRLPEDLKARAQEIGDRVVPIGVRFLIATIDVQINRFEVKIIGVGKGGDFTVIDRFSIKKSTRLDDDGHPFIVQPASYLEDWMLLIPQVIEKTYPLGDDSGRHMKIKAVGCDSGGKDGTTAKAYDFWRYLRDEHPGDHHVRFQLLKGEKNLKAPRVRIDYPDTERKDKHVGARGEIPVLFINSNMVKDQADAMLGRTEPEGGRIVFPTWLEIWYYMELTAETRSDVGAWENPKKHRNESWDLLYYAIAIYLSRHCRGEHIDWENPPGWADVWDHNDMVFNPIEDAVPFSQSQEDVELDLAALGKTLA